MTDRHEQDHEPALPFERRACVATRALERRRPEFRGR
jgi:hypothetical protein